MPSRQRPPQPQTQEITQPLPVQTPPSDLAPEATPAPKMAPKGKRYREMTLDEKEADAKQRKERAEQDLNEIRRLRANRLEEQKKIIGEIVIAVMKRKGREILDEIFNQAAAAGIPPTDTQRKKLIPLYDLAPKPATPTPAAQ